MRHLEGEPQFFIPRFWYAHIEIHVLDTWFSGDLCSFAAWAGKLGCPRLGEFLWVFLWGWIQIFCAQFCERCSWHYEIAPSQFMPNSWRILMSLECLSLRNGVEFILGEVVYTYFLREHDKDKGRYQLDVWHERVHLVTHLRMNDSSWKQSYFFTRGDMVFGPIRPGYVPSF